MIDCIFPKMLERPEMLCELSFSCDRGYRRRIETAGRADGKM